MSQSCTISLPASASAGNFLDLDGPVQSVDPKIRAKLIQMYDRAASGAIKDKILFKGLRDSKVCKYVMSYRDGITLLQTACNYHNNVIATKMVSRILECRYLRGIKNEKRVQLVNYQSPDDGLTVLHIAAKQYNREAALLLLQAGADVTLRCRNNIKPINLIYNRIPEVIITLYNKSIEKENPRARISSDDFTLKVDYSPVCGVHGPVNGEMLLAPETGLLFESLRESEKLRFRILGHPLVKLFLSDKWERMSNIIRGLAFAHIIWCLFYILFTYQLYVSTCPNHGVIRECKPLDLSTLILGWTLLLITIFVGGKAILDVTMLPRDRQHFLFHFVSRPENTCQWTLCLLSIIGVSRLISLEGQELSSPVQCACLEYTFASGGMIIAFLLILWQMKKVPFPFARYHIEMFMRASKNIFIFVIAHLCLLMAFTLAFEILMPQRQEFQFREGGFYKVFNMLATGETNFDDLFHSIKTNSTVPMPFTTKTLLIIFQSIMNLAFLGITIGIALNDCQKLLVESEMVHLTCRLEEMFLLERVLLSKTIQSRWRSRVEKYIVAHDQGNFSFTIKMFRDIAEELRSPILEML